MKYNFIIVLVFAAVQSFSQQNEKSKTSVSIYGGIEWNTISALKGVELDRSIYQNNGLTLGVKLNHAFRYSYSNVALYHSAADGEAKFTTLAATLHYFTSKNDKGLFLQTSLGIGYRRQFYGEIQHSSMLPYFDAGVGWQFPLGKRTALRWTNSLAFAGKGGITSTKLSIVF